MRTQVIREPHPEAVHYCQTQPFRVYCVNFFKADLAGGSEFGIASCRVSKEICLNMGLLHVSTPIPELELRLPVHPMTSQIVLCIFIVESCRCYHME